MVWFVSCPWYISQCLQQKYGQNKTPIAVWCDKQNSGSEEVGDVGTDCLGSDSLYNVELIHQSINYPKGLL